MNAQEKVRIKRNLLKIKCIEKKRKNSSVFFPSIGTFDMFPCIGAPMLGSQPHFYDSDPWLLDNFASGLNPNKKDHAIFMHFETASNF